MQMKGHRGAMEGCFFFNEKHNLSEQHTYLCVCVCIMNIASIGI